ncbi:MULTISPECIES: hypothetical protein [unclassified Candidatus Frackibacter]|uniref:hypothetical protein n=1 Tax=unclassified Candidatus Frackibacter TaxID=2648818 RepID=UPI0007921A36|nr:MULTISPECIES: hypothetical protein [unclassified Candidatus Frackibacter]KXS44734.1 MAG: hypothetical protein AWU54_678 [Candidatus Frackibacter sp. T328-2]SDC41310.1 hypothetical protein SAMN04515661_10975 [Candidatus Frackibacter sp. WG11]SEM59631.1 hypothetical protein SAMN04488698_10845 [Candidatus Frackibacter sp. WG12]SFL62438.1 hypothetical protein SAMN04488699_10774 [Candidatus Frackibacter sp. WG13]
MNKSMKTVAMILVAGMVLSLVGIAVLSTNQSRNTPSVNQGQNVRLTSNQQGVFNALARRYKCLCGDCTLGLYNCTCDSPKGAKEIKGFIKYNLAQGKTRGEVIKLVSSRYGMQPGY